MKVTLVVDSLAPGLGGIGRYTWELCKGLAASEEIEQVDHWLHGRLIEDPSCLLRGPPPPQKSPRLRRWAKRRSLRESLRSSLVHGPNYFLPREAETGVITVHDLSVFRFPETHPRARVEAFAAELPDSIGRAAHVLTDTETVRNEVIDHFGVDPDRITAVPLGVSASFRPREREELALDRFRLEPGGYALCVSTFEPRKKISELIAAWRLLPMVVRLRFPLVLAGGTGWRNEQLLDQIAEARREGWLINLGFVEEAALPHLYSGARLFLYPSTYEGFGLPLLEAMASGVPVITSDRSCLPEVAGGAAMLVDPDDREGFAAAIEQGLTDPGWRARAAQLGRARAAIFRWDRCVDRTIDIYRQALAG